MKCLKEINIWRGEVLSLLTVVTPSRIIFIWLIPTHWIYIISHKYFLLLFPKAPPPWKYTFIFKLFFFSITDFKNVTVTFFVLWLKLEKYWWWGFWSLSVHCTGRETTAFHLKPRTSYIVVEGNQSISSLGLPPGQPEQGGHNSLGEREVQEHKIRKGRSGLALSPSANV